MAANTTTPDGYLVAADGSWVTETQVNGGYVRTPYDNRPYRYDPKWQIYVFDETSECDKAVRVYDEITKRAVYNWGDYTQEDDEVYSILINGTGKCVGFARAYKLLANAVGLKCEFRENGAHMWNAVYVDGIAKSIDTSETRTDVEFYLGTVVVNCPVCGYRNVFGLRETSHPCPGCKTQLDNPEYN